MCISIEALLKIFGLLITAIKYENLMAKLWIGFGVVLDSLKEVFMVQVERGADQVDRDCADGSFARYFFQYSDTLIIRPLLSGKIRSSKWYSTLNISLIGYS